MFRRSTVDRPSRILPFLSSDLGAGVWGGWRKAETASPAAGDSNGFRWLRSAQMGPRRRQKGAKREITLWGRPGLCGGRGPFGGGCLVAEVWLDRCQQVSSTGRQC